jgi:hypothetical protein
MEFSGTTEFERTGNKVTMAQYEVQDVATESDIFQWLF